MHRSGSLRVCVLAAASSDSHVSDAVSSPWTRWTMMMIHDNANDTHTYVCSGRPGPGPTVTTRST